MSAYFSTPLFLAGTTPWFYHDGFDQSADFCIWVLEADGLHASPFNSHTEGDRTLRTMGLDAENWHSWMRKVVSERDHRKYHHQRQSTQKMNDIWKSLQGKEDFLKSNANERIKIINHYQQQIALEQFPTFVAKPFFPVDFWNGDEAVGKRLGEMWEQYNHNHLSEQRDLWGRKRWEESYLGVWEPLGPPDDPSTPWKRLSPEGGEKRQDLRLDLQPYYTRLDGLVIHFVEYPQQIDLLVPPLSAILTLTEKSCDYVSVLTRVLQVAETLATNTHTGPSEG